MNLIVSVIILLKPTKDFYQHTIYKVIKSEALTPYAGTNVYKFYYHIVNVYITYIFKQAKLLP